MNIILALIGLFLLDRVVMGRRWRQKGVTPITPQPKPDLIMIEHTISKHKTAVVVVPTYNTPPQDRRPLGQACYVTASKYLWTKERCLAYVEEVAKKGYVVGAQVVTKYGNAGVIASIREIPEEGMSFFGDNYPNLFSVHRPMLGNNGIWYNELEVTIQPK